MEKESAFNVRNLTKMALCMAFCIVSGFISFPLPFTPGLVTALTVALTVTALVLPPKLTFIIVAAYVFICCCGLPIFPGGVGGLGRILGPTGGFYLGWPIVCFIESCVKGKSIDLRRYLIAAIVFGVPLTYVGGLISMMYVMKVGLLEGIMMAVVPFVIGDILKGILAAFIGFRVNKMLANR